MTMHLITVDTECSSHPGALGVTGQIGREEVGVRKLAEVFRAHGLRATFFVDVYEAQEPRARLLREACRDLQAAGHDLELHTHPTSGGARTNGQMARHGFDEQVAILRQGQALFREWFGQEPVAHRAGDWAANADTLRALRAVGIPVDSSLFFGWPACALRDGLRPSNRPRMLDGVLEVPPTVFYSPGFGVCAPHRLLTTDGHSYGELRSVLRQLARGTAAVAVSVFHSFSLLEWNRRRTRYWVARRKLEAFERLIEDIARTGQGRTFRELHARYQEDPASIAGGREELPRSAARFFVPRLLDRGRLALRRMAR